MKPCISCQERKPASAFYRHPRMADGRLNKCKECVKEAIKKNRRERAEYYREYDKTRAMLPHRVEMRDAYAKTPNGRAAHKRARQKYAERHAIKRAAHIMTGNAIRDGRLLKQPCEVCGKKKVHAHHDDYLKPFDVRWFCTKHHRQWHRDNSG